MSHRMVSPSLWMGEGFGAGVQGELLKGRVCDPPLRHTPVMHNRKRTDQNSPPRPPGSIPLSPPVMASIRSAARSWLFSIA